MKRNTPNIDLAAEVAANPSSEADAPKAPAKKASTKKASTKKASTKKATPAPANPAPTAKMLQAAADKASREEAKVAHKKEQAAAAKKQLTTFKSDAKVFINAGNAAIKHGIKSNLLWTVAAHKLRELCATVKGQSFAALAKEHWGCEANTATKLANSGRLIFDIQTTAETAEGPEKNKWADNMPMMNLNCLSVISGMHDTVIELGIDKGIIHPRSTEAEINELNRLWDKNGKKVKPPIDPPSTSQRDSEDADGVSDSDSSETTAQLIARIVLLTKSLTTSDVLDLIADLEEMHPDVLEDADKGE